MSEEQSVRPDQTPDSGQVPLQDPEIVNEEEDSAEFDFDTTESEEVQQEEIQQQEEGQSSSSDYPEEAPSSIYQAPESEDENYHETSPIPPETINWSKRTDLVYDPEEEQPEIQQEEQQQQEIHEKEEEPMRYLARGYPAPPIYPPPPPEKPQPEETTEDKIKRLQEECDEAKKDRDIWYGAFTEAARKLVDKETDLRISYKVNTAWQKEIEEKREEIILLQADNDRYYKHYKKARRERNKFHTERDECWDELDDLQEKIDRNHSRLEQLKERINTNKRSFKTFQGTVSIEPKPKNEHDLRAQVEDIKRDFNKVLAQRDQERERHRIAEEMMCNDQNLKEQSYIDANKKLQAEVDELKKQVKTMKQKMTKSDKDWDELRDQKKQLEAELGNKKEELRQAQNQISDYKRAADVLEKDKEKFEEKSKEQIEEFKKLCDEMVRNIEYAFKSAGPK